MSPLGTWPPPDGPGKVSRVINYTKGKVTLFWKTVKTFFKGENLEVVLLILGVALAYNWRLLFTDIPDQRVAFIMGVTIFGTPTLLLYFYYKKLQNIFSRTIVIALILLTLKEFLGGFLYLLDIKMELFNNFTYGTSFYSQVGFMVAVIGISYLRASKIDGMVISYFCRFDGDRGCIHRFYDKKRNSSPKESVTKDKKPS